LRAGSAQRRPKVLGDGLPNIRSQPGLPGEELEHAEHLERRLTSSSTVFEHATALMPPDKVQNPT
jgi:hypothetical protein